MFLPLLVGSGKGEDSVILSTSTTPQGWVRIPGNLERVTEKSVFIRGKDGSLREYAGRKLLRVETRLLPEHKRGDELFVGGHFAEALQAYRSALDNESRPLVAAQVRIQIVWCLRYLGRRAEACREFFTLATGEVPAVFAPAAPVNWLPGAPDPLIEALCASHLGSPSAVVDLVAASHLLGGVHAKRALVELDRLAATAPEPIRTVAWFQTCRQKTMTVDEKDLWQWEGAWEKIPAEWQAGPAAVVAQGWEGRRNFERASLWWLRLAILFPGHRDLAARALLAAGRNLERLGQPEQAAVLYRELLVKYPESPDSPAAQARLEALAAPAGQKARQ